MAQESAPAYQWYVRDARSSRAIQRMSFSERGVYREMLDQQWEDLTLPDDPQALAELIATTEAQMAEVIAAWPVVRRKFVAIDGQPGRIHNLRLEVVRAERKAWHKGKRKGGKARATAAARSGDGTFQQNTSSTPAASQQEPAGHQQPSSPSSASSSASASSSSSASKKQEPEKAVAQTPRRFQPPENPDDNVSVITKIAHEAIDIEGVTADNFTLREAVKSLCAIRGIDYDGRAVTKAIESAIFQRTGRAS